MLARAGRFNRSRRAHNPGREEKKRAKTEKPFASTEQKIESGVERVDENIPDAPGDRLFCVSCRSLPLVMGAAIIADCTHETAVTRAKLGSGHETKSSAKSCCARCALLKQVCRNCGASLKSAFAKRANKPKLDKKRRR